MLLTMKTAQQVLRYRCTIALLIITCLGWLTPLWAEENNPNIPTLSTDGAAVHLSALGTNQPAASQNDSQASKTINGGFKPAQPYGSEGTEWILFGGGAAYDLSNNTDININIGYSRFLVDDVEWLLELGAWYHSQEGDDAASLNPLMEFRWHFYNQDKTSLFVNLGIGMFFATDNIPDKGTGFDFSPRAGIGLTHQIAEDGTRLITGIRWHHISNARIAGEFRNPSRDAPMVYVQFAIPF